MCITYLGLYRYLASCQPLERTKCFRALYCISVAYTGHILGIYFSPVINSAVDILVVGRLVTVYSKHMPLVNCIVIYIGTAVLITDMAAVLQLYQLEIMLCICRIYV